MHYDQAVSFIHGIARFGSKPGLRRIRRLLSMMDNPQKELKFIHVAGTNGKGSTCAMLESVLRRAGYKTGLYISPFVIDFRERIQRAGQMIDPADFALSATRVKPLWDELDEAGDTPSEFETLLAVALDYYHRQKPDIIVLEVGLGGRWDATNIIDTPEASVITSLSLDHTEYLGDTIEEIAFEKCGIIKPGGVTVCYPEQAPAAMAVIERRCAEQGNRLIVGGQAEVLGMDFFGTRMRYRDLILQLPLIGMHQVKNAVVVLETLAAIREEFPVSAGDIAAGVEETVFPARLELISRDPLLVLDGAHNQSGAEVLGKALDLLEGRKIHVVMGMLGNKDASGALAEILPRCESLVAVPIKSNPLGLNPVQLAEAAKPYCKDVSAATTAQAGVDLAWSRRQGDDVVLVCGSLYLASELRPYLLRLAGR